MGNEIKTLSAAQGGISPLMGRIERMVAEMCPEGVKWVPIERIAKVYSGKNKSKKSEGPYPVYGSTGIIAYCDNYVYDSKQILIARVGANAGFTHIAEGQYDVSDNTLIVSLDSGISIIYLYHLLLNINLNQFAKGGGQPLVTAGEIKKITIPLPPLPIQEAIADILDKFDRLSAELQTELQAELQARKQQYEYYRNQLLTRFAPDQPVTEYSLGDLGTFTRGTGLQKSDFVDEGFPCIHYGQIYTRFKTFTDKTLTFVEEDLAQKLLHADSGDLIIATTSENVEDVCKSVAWLGEGQIVTGGHACVYHHNQNPKYMAYFFQTDYFHNQKKKYAYGAKVIDIKVDNIAKITIPLPSLEEQARIVSILDKFEELVNDLSQGLPAEIAAVQEQYEYYRNKLFTFDKAIN